MKSARALDYADIVGANGRGHGCLIDDDHWARDEIQLEIGTGLEVENGWTLGVDLGGRFGSGAAIGSERPRPSSPIVKRRTVRQRR